MDKEREAKEKQHELVLEKREKLKITGITDVDSFNSNTVSISTQMGNLVIKGDDLHISSLDVDEGNVMIQGFVISCVYTNSAEPKTEKSFFKSIFK